MQTPRAPLDPFNSTQSCRHMNRVIRGRICVVITSKTVTPRPCACCDTSDSKRREPGLPESYETWPATTPPPRRLFLGGLAGSAVVLGGNFGGITSALLGVTQALHGRHIVRCAEVTMATAISCISQCESKNQVSVSGRTFQCFFTCWDIPCQQCGWEMLNSAFLPYHPLAWTFS